MKKSLYLWQFVGFVFTAVAGTLLHFLYEWSNEGLVFALFSAVNESVWEHMKLLFFPMILFALVEERFLGGEYDHFWCTKLVGILTGLILIPVLYYSYTGIFGVSLDWLNIVIFFVTAAISYILETKLLEWEDLPCLSKRAALVVMIAIGLAFVVFTFVQPRIPLFQDPNTKGYGMK